MKFSRLAITASFLGLAACNNTPKYAAPTEPFCQADANGHSINDPKNGPMFTMGKVHEKRDDYIWGDAVKADSSEPTGLGLNIHLKDGKISWCEVADSHGEGRVYYPQGPSGMGS